MIDRKPGLDFVRPSGEAAKHAARLLLIFGLAKDILIQHHNGIGCNDRCPCPLCLKDALCLPAGIEKRHKIRPLLAGKDLLYALGKFKNTCLRLFWRFCFWKRGGQDVFRPADLMDELPSTRGCGCQNDVHGECSFSEKFVV